MKIKKVDKTSLLVNDFKELNFLVIFIYYFSNFSSCCVLEDALSMFPGIFQLTIIFIIVWILNKSISFDFPPSKFSTLYFFTWFCYNCIRAKLTFLKQALADCISIFKYNCSEALIITFFKLSPAAILLRQLELPSTMFIILMPLSNILNFAEICQYSHSFSLALIIYVASVYIVRIIPTISISISIFEPVFDGLQFRLEQPPKLFRIGYMEYCIRENL